MKDIGNQETKTAVGYTRVSTTSQADEGVSLSAQESKIRAWADLNGYTLREVFTDAGISGTGMDNRDGLSDALDALQPGEALIAYSLSRLSRSTRDMLDIADLISNKRADLVSLSEKIETTTAAGKMIFRLLAVLNEFERDQISERTKTALDYKRTKGEWCGRPPYGYEIADNGHLIENQQEMKVIAKAKRMRRGGKSLRDISKALGLSLGYVHKALNVNLRTLKAKYINGQRPSDCS